MLTSQPELDALSFPLLAYTYLDLIEAGFTSTGGCSPQFDIVLTI